MAALVDCSENFPKLSLRYLGFCGIDDSVEPAFLQLISSRYPFIEWGVLFRPDLEGTPRYASSAWLMRLIAVNNNSKEKMNFAAHLCQRRCSDLLDGDYTFVSNLREMGFKRVQINATRANGVHLDSKLYQNYNENLRCAARVLTDIEWILQKNDETADLWKSFEQDPLPNISILFDASCGKGITMATFPTPYSNPSIPCGYAGGISPHNIETVLRNVAVSSQGVPVWVDMESSLRVLVSDPPDAPPRDCFSLDKCFSCAQTVERILTNDCIH